MVYKGMTPSGKQYKILLFVDDLHVVTFIYMPLYTIHIVLKQLRSNMKITASMLQNHLLLLFLNYSTNTILAV